MADKAMIGRANGVGPKLAARIVNELKDKIGAAAIGSALAAGSTAVPVSSHAADAVSALQNLGYRPAEASTAVAAAEEELGGGATRDALVRLARKKAAKVNSAYLSLFRYPYRIFWFCSFFTERAHELRAEQARPP